MKTRGLRIRFCPRCRRVAPHRTLYAKTETGGRSRWFQLYRICTACRSLNHIVLPCYKLLSVPSGLPSPLAISVVDALREASLDISELLRDLRRRRGPGSPHIFNSEVAMVLAYLKSQRIVTEEMTDRTALTLVAMAARPSKSKHLGPCPEEMKQCVARKSLVSLYSQRWMSVTRDGQGPAANKRRLVPVGVFCLHCQYHRIDPDALLGYRAPRH